jgi:hypothetical protein
MYVSGRDEKVTVVGVRRVARSRAEGDSKGTGQLERPRRLLFFPSLNLLIVLTLAP